MNLQQLRYATEIEKTGSITKAAKNLYMGQPNLSKSIKELEQELGVTIFERTTKGVKPTRMGLEFLSYAHTILAQMEELESLYKPRSEKDFSFSVSVPRATYLAAAFTQFLSEYVSDGPMDVHFRETSSMAAIQDVATGSSQLGIIRSENIHEHYFLNFLSNMHLESKPIWEFQMCLLMSKDHPLANCNEIVYHMLDGYIEIAHGDFQVPSLTAADLSEAAKNMGSKRRISIYERGSQYDLLKRLPGTYMWVSPIPCSILQENGLVLKQCAVGAVSKDLLITRTGHSFTKEEQAFLNTVRRFTENNPFQVEQTR